MRRFLQDSFQRFKVDAKLQVNMATLKLTSLILLAYLQLVCCYHLLNHDKLSQEVLDTFPFEKRALFSLAVFNIISFCRGGTGYLAR